MMLKEAGIDRHGPYYDVKDVRKSIVSEIVLDGGKFLTRMAKKMTKDYEDAAKITEEADLMFNQKLNKLSATTDNLSASIKKVSGNVRKAADDLASGLLKVEKTANFANLEKSVILLERAAAAISVLADLENSGKLEKITSALK